MTLIVIGGATASGKSALALDVAERIGAEIVNADSMQLYKGMDIGTAKVPFEERRGIPHHMLDTLEVTEESSVADYQREARALIDSRLAQDIPVVVVGGTGLYIKALIDELNFPDRDPDVRERLFAEAEELGATAMHQRLAALDADAAALIPEQNLRRVIRALEVIELTGEPYAASLPRNERSYYPQAQQFAIRVEREVLNERISERVAQMWRDGFLSEVEKLVAQGLRDGRTARAAIGYAQVLAALEGQISIDLAMDETVTSTRQYARRQATWFGRENRIRWLEGSPAKLLESILSSSGNS
ncbi:MAG: tRNA (adenosine(37)-N6)-dimethylallyltransferase MiaA [Candidatus Nanopelagicaceae bacterium]